MKNWKTHFFSAISLVAFVLLAMASGDGTGVESWTCNDPVLKTTEPTTPIGSGVATYQIRVLDKETNDPIPNLTVTAAWNSYNFIPLMKQGQNCPEKCYRELHLKAVAEGKTNANGIFSGDTPAWQAHDIKDKMVGEILIDDPSSIYVPKRMVVRFGNGETSGTFTAHLLKINSL
jgi:hypothetical protein